MIKKYVIRENALKTIKPFIGKNIIKVITGQRRVGKSYILKQIKDKLGKKKTIYIKYEHNFQSSINFVKKKTPIT